MGITRERLQHQLASLDRQREQTLVQLANIDGAKKQCQHWLALLDQEAAAQQTAAAAPANGEPAAH